MKSTGFNANKFSPSIRDLVNKVVAQRSTVNIHWSRALPVIIAEKISRLPFEHVGDNCRERGDMYIARRLHV